MEDWNGLADSSFPIVDRCCNDAAGRSDRRYVLVAVLGVLLLQGFWTSYSQVETIPYSEFETLLDQGKVAEVTVGADSIQGTVKEPLPSGKREFFAVRVDPQLAEKLASHQVVVKGAEARASGWTAAAPANRVYKACTAATTSSRSGARLGEACTAATTTSSGSGARLGEACTAATTTSSGSVARAGEPRRVTLMLSTGIPARSRRRGVRQPSGPPLRTPLQRRWAPNWSSAKSPACSSPRSEGSYNLQGLPEPVLLYQIVRRSGPYAAVSS